MKRWLFALTLLLIMGAVKVYAQQDPRIKAYLAAKGTMDVVEMNQYLDQLFPEWQLTKMRNFCLLISNRPKDNHPGCGYKYLYQHRLFEAARIDTANDSKEVIGKKIAAMWAVCDQLDLLLCSSTQFDVTKGNLLKWAVSYQFDDFIVDLFKWKVQLNKIDESDNRTLLDYIQYHVTKNKDNAMGPVYQDYYDRFRAAGARHKWEL